MLPNRVDKEKEHHGERDATEKIGRFCSDTEYPIILIPSDNSAAAPATATARPTMNIGELVTAVHMIEPTSKIMSAKRYVNLTSGHQHVCVDEHQPQKLHKLCDPAVKLYRYGVAAA
jgi:hypothetical protein